uniref:Uncharacterized protein n=1 Tax=Aegilops tauschii subsp. strangulata TaxID=200361 RepID=A0A453F4Q8_AEGTS
CSTAEYRRSYVHSLAMVAGRVKAAMGFHSSPRAPKSPAPAATAPAEGYAYTPARGPSSSTSSPAPCGSASKASAFARSLGAYFPRSSAQVQPARAPPEVAGLLRAIEQLQERESRLRVELLEQKILRETVAIVPFLEAELAAKSSEVERYKESAARLESENMRLCAELDAAALEVTSRKQRIVQMEKEMAELRKQHDADDCCSTELFVILVHVDFTDGFRLVVRHGGHSKNPRARAVEAAADTSATATATAASADAGTQPEHQLRLNGSVRKRRRATSSAPAPAVQEDMFAGEIGFVREARA